MAIGDSDQSDDKILHFPAGSGPNQSPGGQASDSSDFISTNDSGPAFSGPVSEPGKGEVGLPGLTADQEKAIQVVMNGMDFVLVGIRPTETGADFFTAMNGDARALYNAMPHLAGVIERAYRRKGII